MSIQVVNEFLNKAVEDLSEGDMFLIGQGGLEKLKTGKIRIQPNTFYYMGASSSPERILVTKVSERSIDYQMSPYSGKQRSIGRSIGEDLIFKGVTTWMKLGYNEYPWGRKEKIKFEKLLAGKSVKPIKPKDYAPVTVTVVAAKGYEKKDLWREAEKYGGVGAKGEPGSYQYVISMESGGVKRLRQDKHFDVISVKKRK